MALELHPFVAISSVEVVDVNEFFVGDASKEMSSVGESDLVTALEPD